MGEVAQTTYTAQEVLDKVVRHFLIDMNLPGIPTKVVDDGVLDAPDGCVYLGESVWPDKTITVSCAIGILIDDMEVRKDARGGVSRFSATYPEVFKKMAGDIREEFFLDLQSAHDNAASRAVRRVRYEMAYHSERITLDNAHGWRATYLQHFNDGFMSRIMRHIVLGRMNWDQLTISTPASAKA